MPFAAVGCVDCWCDVINIITCSVSVFFNRFVEYEAQRIMRMSTEREHVALQNLHDKTNRNKI